MIPETPYPMMHRLSDKSLRNVPHREAWRILSTAFVLLASSACERNGSNEQAGNEQIEQSEPPLLEPDVRKPKMLSRCAVPPGTMPSTLRAAVDSGAGKNPVELGMAVAVQDGFVVSGLTSGSETKAFVFFTDGRGKEKKVDLGRVHGAVEAPLLASFGPHLLVAVIDNDAMNTRIRLAKVSGISKESQVTWGSEVQATRDETTTVSLAAVSGGTAPRALLVWDNFDKAASRSRIQGLWFSPETMKAEALPHVLSAPEQDVVEPRLLARSSGGAWLTWLAYGKMSTDLGPREGDSPLVSEPPRWLEVRKLSSGTSTWASPLRISPENERILTYDSEVSGERLIVAYRGEAPGDTSESAPFELRVVGQDGSIQQSALQNRELGPGAPLLLAGELPGSTWLVAKGDDQELFWGSVHDSGTVDDFNEEPVLEGQIPLTRTGDEILLMKPEGLDLKLSTWLCKSAQKQAEPSSAP